MKMLLYTELEKDIEISDASNTTIMGAVTKKLLEQFAKFEIPNNIEKLALTASYLSPEHYVKQLSEQPEITLLTEPFIKNVVGLITEIKGPYVPETQEIGNSQPRVILTPNLPKDDNNSKDTAAPKNPFYGLFTMSGNCKPTRPPQSKVRKWLEEVIAAETDAYTSYCGAHMDEIY